MTAIDKVLPDALAKRLIQYNIRSLEQFVSLAEIQGQAESLAATLDVNVEEIDSLVEKIHRQYPDLKIPKRSDRKYYMGYPRP